MWRGCIADGDSQSRESQVTLPRGSYCWKASTSGTCADSAGPAALLRTGYLKPYKITSGARARVTFSSNPRSVAVRLVVAPHQPQSSESHSGASFDLPVSPGLYLYAISATWPESSVDFYLAVRIMSRTS